MRLPLHLRLECERSYAEDDDFRLKCEINDSICDGELYDCCLWDENIAEQVRLIMPMMEQEG